MDGVSPRLKLKKIDFFHEEPFRARVTLTGRDQEFVGEKSGGNNEQERLAITVLATLEAVSLALNNAVSFDIKGINDNEVFEGLPETLLLVVVGIKDENGETITPGSCRVTGDKFDAAVKAALDATNRVVESRW